MQRQHCELNIDCGIALAQCSQGLRQQVRDHAGRRTDPYAPFQTQHLALNIVQRLFRIGQQTTRALDQHLPNRRGPYLPALPLKKRCSDTVFRIGDMEAACARREFQRACCIGE